jgi:hypothetical protein
MLMISSPKNGGLWSEEPFESVQRLQDICRGSYDIARDLSVDEDARFLFEEAGKISKPNLSIAWRGSSMSPRGNRWSGTCGRCEARDIRPTGHGKMLNADFSKTITVDERGLPYPAPF